MREREPMTQTMDVSHVRQDFKDVLSSVSERRTRVLIEEQGKPVAGIVSAEDLARLNQLDAQWDEDWRVFDDIHARNLDKTAEEVERDVAEALSAVSAQARREAKRRSPR